MNKILKVLKNRRGITLIEMVVAMLIFTVIATAVTSIFTPVFRVYAKSNDLAEFTVLINNIGTDITDNLSKSTANAVISDEQEIVIKIDSGTIEYKLNNDGILQRKYGTNDPKIITEKPKLLNWHDVYSEEYYRGKKLDIKFVVTYAEPEKEKKPIYTLTLSIKDSKDESIIISREFAICPIILNQS